MCATKNGYVLPKTDMCDLQKQIYFSLLLSFGNHFDTNVMMTSKFANLFSYQYQPVARPFYSCLSAAEYVVVKQTCKDLYAAATAYQKAVFDINSHLRLFFSDARKLRLV